MILFFIILKKTAIVFEILTATIGTCYYYKYKHVPILKYFAFLIWYIVCNELIGYYLKFIGCNNALTYNIYHVINFSYLLLLYRRFLKNNAKHITTLLIIIYLLVVIINGFYENYWVEYQSVPYIVAAAAVIIAIILYFIEILNSKQVLYTDKILLFWISCGLLLYYVGIIPFRILLNYYESVTDASVYFILNFALTIIINIFYSVGFIWSSDKQET